MANETNMKIPGVIAYFTVSDTKAATAFYEKAFGAKLDRPQGDAGWPLHARPCRDQWRGDDAQRSLSRARHVE